MTSLDFVSGAYFALWMTMLTAGLMYLRVWRESKDDLDAAQSLIFFGIALFCISYAVDLSLWLPAQAVRAVFGFEARPVVYIVEHMPFLPVIAKAMTSLGVLLHIRVRCIRLHPRMTLPALIGIWVAMFAGFAYLLSVLRGVFPAID